MRCDGAEGVLYLAPLCKLTRCAILLRFVLIAVSTLIVVSTGGQSQAGADLDRGAVVFKKCVSCHEVERPRNKMGPHLNGLVGRTAGTVDGFKYSQAMRDAGTSGLVWNDANLHEFISSPKKKVPGTSMRFFGLWSDSDIDDLIAYIRSMPAKNE